MGLRLVWLLVGVLVQVGFGLWCFIGGAGFMLGFELRNSGQHGN